MRAIHPLIAGLLVFAAAVATGEAGGKQKQPGQTTPAASTTAAVSRGQRVFNQNCGRCHNSPEGFPPGVSGTIAKHMRVRAGLSEQDYKALLKFLNP